MSTLDRKSFIKKSIVAAGTAALGMGAANCRQSSGPGNSSSSQTYNWKMVTTWPRNFPGLGTGANNLAKMLETMSGGRIRVTVYGAGELVPAFEVFTTVSNGDADLGHSAAYYWKGKVEAAQFFAAVPFGMNAAELSGWIHYGGGQELWDELYADFNLKPFICGNTGVQMGGWYNREINSMGDYNGLKIRMPGLGGEVLRKAGATVIQIPGGEIFQSLQTGAIDATEWVGPYNDLSFGFHKIAKHYYWPGWHEPGTALEMLVNRETYEGLPDDLKEIVRVACKAAHEDMMAEFQARNATALKSLIQQHGVQVKPFPDAVLKRLGELSEEVIAGIGATDAQSRKIFDSYKSFRSSAIEWSKIGEEGYFRARAQHG